MITRLAAAGILIAGIAALGWTLITNSADSGSEVTSNAAADPSPVDPASDDTGAAVATETTAAPENFGARKDLVELDGWLNTDIDSLDDLDGQVYLVEMWTFGCSNCKARIPHNQDLYAQYKDDGFEIVGVHAPEFDYEKDVANIEAAIADLGVTWPVALDTNKQNFRAWQEGGRRFWPRTYVVDQNGDVRYDHIGEGRYDELEQTVGYLLANPPA